MSQTNTSQHKGLDAIMQPSSITEGEQTREKCISKLDSFLTKYSQSDFGPYQQDIKSVINLLTRARKEFDSTCFFVLIVGPLKSGKSSFVNILTRAQVSPTDVLECTAIPTIIGKSDKEHKGKIIGYYPKANASEGDDEKFKQEIFNSIIDVLRGIEPHSVLDNRVDKDIKEANADVINEMVMVNGSSQQPFLATIGVDKDGFIDDQIMIIDMPGLDGRDVNNRNPLYQSMVERADFIFFVQSSTSAINEATSDFLKGLLSNKMTQVPLWLIHNHHESLGFLSDDVTKKMVDRQVQAGVQCIKDMLKVEKKFDHYIFNFAKIGNTLMTPHNVKEEMKDSLVEYTAKYLEWEKNISRQLKEERQQIKNENCIVKCDGSVQQSLDIIQKTEAAIDSELEKIRIRNKELDNLPQLIRKTKVSFSEAFEVVKNKITATNALGLLQTHIQTETATVISNINTKLSGKDLQLIIDNLAATYNNISIFGQYGDIWNTAKEEISKVLKLSYSNVLSDIDKVLALQSAVQWDSSINDSYLPNALEPFVSNVQGIKKHFLGVFTKKYNRETCKTFINQLEQQCTRECVGKVDQYEKKIELAASTIKSEWVEKLLAQLEERTAAIKKSLDAQQKDLEQYKTTLREMKNALK